MSAWERLGAVDPDARLELHWALQAAAAPGKLLLPHAPDWSEQSFVWCDGARALAQGLVAAGPPFRSALRLMDPMLQLLAEDDAPLAELPLAGRTLEEAYTWLERELPLHLGRPLEKPLERPSDLPEHPVGHGASFTGGTVPARAELARWFAAAHRLLSVVAAENPEASPLRCWPHHFDLATLLTLDTGMDPKAARSIGVGLSPGDAGRPAPYFYVTPWPYPDAAGLPALDGGGCWNTAGWVGAVLEAADLIPAADQEDKARSFLASAVATCRHLLAG